MRQTEGSSPRNTWAHSLFCFVLFCSDIVICVISWLPLPVCLCRKLHSEMGEPHHVLCGQCVCSCRLIIDTHTPITHLYTPLHTCAWTPVTKDRDAERTSRQQGATKCHPIHAVSRLPVHEDAVTVMHLSCRVTSVLLMVSYLELFISCLRPGSMYQQPKKQLYSSVFNESPVWEELDIYTENGEIKVEEFMSVYELLVFLSFYCP